MNWWPQIDIKGLARNSTVTPLSSSTEINTTALVCHKLAMSWLRFGCSHFWSISQLPTKLQAIICDLELCAALVTSDLVTRKLFLPCSFPSVSRNPRAAIAERQSLHSHCESECSKLNGGRRYDSWLKSKTTTATTNSGHEPVFNTNN